MRGGISSGGRTTSAIAAAVPAGAPCWKLTPPFLDGSAMARLPFSRSAATLSVPSAPVSEKMMPMAASFSSAASEIRKLSIVPRSPGDCCEGVTRNLPLRTETLAFGAAR